MGKYKYSIQQQQPIKQYDAVFIRHAQSYFNKGAFTYIQNNQLYDFTWLDLITKQDFNKKVTYNPDFIDPHLTQRGIQQQFNPSQIELIIVSPHRRALHTCRQIFGDHKNVIVHPLVTQVFRYSCDEMKNWSDQWFIQVLSPQKRQICQKYFETNNIIDFKSRQLAVVQLLSKGILSETAHQLRQRVGKLKQLIKKIKNEHKVKKIAVISHHYTTQCLLSPAFNQDSSVKGIGTIQNGKPYFRKLQDILKVK